MTGKTHVAISAAAVSVALATAQAASSRELPSPFSLGATEPGTAQLGGYAVAGLLLIGIVAGLFPDLDAPDTELQHLPCRAADRLAKLAKASMPRRSLLATMAQGFIRLAILPFALMLAAIGAGLRAFTGHRGFTHTLWGTLTFTGIAVGATILSTDSLHWSFAVGTVWLLGYSSHLAADACTPSGIPLFMFPRNPMRSASPDVLGGCNRDIFVGKRPAPASYSIRSRSPRPLVVHLLPKRMRVRTGTMVDILLIRWGAWVLCAVAVAFMVTAGS